MTDTHDWPLLCAEVHHMLYDVPVAKGDYLDARGDMITSVEKDKYYTQLDNEVWVLLPDYLRNDKAMRELAADCTRLKDWTVGVYVEGQQFSGWCWVRRQGRRKAHTYEALADTRAKAQVLAIWYALKGVKNA